MNIKLVDKLSELYCSDCDGSACGGCNVRTQIEEILEGEGIGKRPRKGVYCITTDREFATLKLASDHYKIVPATISKCCKGKLRYAGKFGGKKLEWRYVNE